MTYVYLQYQDTQKLNVLVKFVNEKELQRWVTCVKFGMMIESSRKKDKLFFVPKEEPVVSVPATMANSPLPVQSSPQHLSTSPSQLLMKFNQQSSPS